jgi:hypothetical protein
VRALLLLLPLAACAESPKLNIASDPRVELVTIVQMLAGYRDPPVSALDTAYKRAAAEWFAPYAGHPVVELCRKRARSGFRYDTVASVTMATTPPPEIRLERDPPSGVIRRAGGRRGIDEWLAALRDFSQKSRFPEFFEKHESTYARVTQNFRSQIEGVDYVKLLEDYFGSAQGSYNVVLGMLIHPGGFGPRYPRANGTFDIVAVLGPVRLDGDVPSFGTRASIEYLVWHEFGHSFVNPLVDKYWGRIRKTSKLYEPIRDAMQRQAYGNWQSSVHEHIVRAVTIRLTARERAADAQNLLNRERDTNNFRYVEPLVERLKEYETSRDRYPTFDSFMPRLIDVFAAIKYTPAGT